jgi:hypothetical protein
VELSDRVKAAFVAAGWRPGRRVGVPSGVDTAHPAHEVLQEFGGLRVGRTGSGEECATSDLEFCLVRDFDDVEAWEMRLGVRLVGVGEAHKRHGEVYVDNQGRCFGAWLNTIFVFEGGTFSAAMECLLLGRRSRPLLPPGEDTVVLYGERYRRGDPRLFQW